jgi:hypothetical protein
MRQVRDGEDAIANTRDACAPQIRVSDHSFLSFMVLDANIGWAVTKSSFSSS